MQQHAMHAYKLTYKHAYIHCLKRNCQDAYVQDKTLSEKSHRQVSTNEAHEKRESLNKT